MELPLIYYGNPVLRQKTTPIKQIDDSVRQLVANMLQTMHKYKGIGLAAPQVNHSLSVFVTFVPIEVEEDKWVDGEERVYINPKILWHSDDLQTMSEGCLSLPKIYVDVTRPVKIRIQAMNLDGELFEAELSGLDAINFMHENDHLHGVLNIDRMDDRKLRKALEPKLRQIKQQYNK